MTALTPEQVVDLDQVLGDVPAAPASGSLDAVDEQLIARLVGRAREGRLRLTGEGGCLPSSRSGWSSPLWKARSPITSDTCRSAPAPAHGEGGADRDLNAQPGATAERCSGAADLRMRATLTARSQSMNTAPMLAVVPQPFAA